MRCGNLGICFPQLLVLTGPLSRRGSLLAAHQLLGSDVVLQVAAKQIQDLLGQLLQ